MAETTSRFSGKLNKNMIPIIGGAMIVGMIVFFAMSYGTHGDAARNKAIAEKALAKTQAAQIGGGPESLEEATAAINAQVDKAKEEKRRKELEERLAAAVARDEELRAKGIKPPPLPRREASDYRRADREINAKQAPVSYLPASFDDEQIVDPKKKGAIPAFREVVVGEEEAQYQQESLRAKREQKARESEREKMLAAALQQGQPAQDAGYVRDPNDAWRDANKAKKDVPTEYSDRLYTQKAPVSHLLQEGSVINGVVLNAIHSQFPGRITARVTRDVYDSIRQRHLLIPAGSRLEGEYNADVKFGQTRVYMAFHRIILPSGASVMIDSWRGSDALGRSGTPADDVNNHLLAQFGTGILVAGLAYMAETNTNATVVTTQGANGQPESMGQASGKILYEMGRDRLGKYQQLKPEITVDAGAKVTLIVAQDVEIPAAAQIKPSR